MKQFFKFFWGALALVCFIGIGTFMSCSTEDSIREAIEETVDSGDSEPPVFLECKAISPREISFQFSRSVKVVTLNFEPALEVESTSNGETVNVVLKEALVAGDSVTADLLVEDDAKHTLNVLVPFKARNNRIPNLLITELQDNYTKDTRIEFVELKALNAGNLGAVRLYITSYTKDPLVFDFPSVEVKTGEYICVHLRTLDEGAVDETGSDLTLSGGKFSTEGRDFWIPGSNKILHQTDIVYLMDQDDNIIDAAMMSESPDSWGTTKDHFTLAAELLHEQGAWLSNSGGIPGPGDAIPSAKETATRSISRDETTPDTNKAGDWYITAHTTKNPGATPGKPNNPTRFE
ncbi:hypothetical protein FACS189485_12300 [Spirochaetia bacterium]|nr:hypothetical protein FACS189485_12300 [Spirochaetia bacterium]